MAVPISRSAGCHAVDRRTPTPTSAHERPADRTQEGDRTHAEPQSREAPP